MPPFTTAERIHAVEDIVNYDFCDKPFLVKALEAAGATMAHQGNKRLTLIGDAVVRLVLFELCYETEASIGGMTDAHNIRATNENLANIDFFLGIDAYIQLNPSSQGVVPRRLMTTTIEAIIGAVYLDYSRDTEVVRHFDSSSTRHADGLVELYE